MLDLANIKGIHDACKIFWSFYNPSTHPYLKFMQIEKTVQFNGQPLMVGGLPAVMDRM